MGSSGIGPEGAVTWTGNQDLREFLMLDPHEGQEWGGDCAQVTVIKRRGGKTKQL